MSGQAVMDGPFPGDDGQGPAAAFAAEGDDFELDGHFAWLVRELDAGRVQPPPERAVAGPGVSLSLGDACQVDPGLLAAMCGPDGLGGQAAGAAFGQDKARGRAASRSGARGPGRRGGRPGRVPDR